MEQIDLPLAAGSLDNLPNEDNLLHQDPDAMDVDDGDDAELVEDALNDYGIEIDYSQLDDDLKNVSHGSQSTRPRARSASACISADRWHAPRCSSWCS